MKGLHCSYCNKFIEEGQKAYNDRIHCSVFCSLECLALYTIERQRYDVLTLDDQNVKDVLGVE